MPPKSATARGARWRPMSRPRLRKDDIPMIATTPFSGRVLSDHQHLLGEGATYDPVTDTAWWFSILEKELHEMHVETGAHRVHALPLMASVLARIDDSRQLLVTEEGLHI